LCYFLLIINANSFFCGQLKFVLGLVSMMRRFKYVY
jgi:hypothetical protein